MILGAQYTVVMGYFTYLGLFRTGDIYIPYRVFSGLETLIYRGSQAWRYVWVNLFVDFWKLQVKGYLGLRKKFEGTSQRDEFLYFKIDIGSGARYTKSETVEKDTQPLLYADGVNVNNEK